MLTFYLKRMCIGSLLALAVISCNSGSDDDAPTSSAIDKPIIPADLVKPEFAEDATPTVDLSDAIIYGGSIKSVTTNVEISTKTMPDGIRFWMTRDDPREGDFAAMTFTLDSLIVGEGYELKMDVDNPYLRPKNKGYIAYQVLMDDEVLLSEDAAMSNEINRIQVSWNADKPEMSFTIRSLAIVDCPPWGFGKGATPIIVNNLSLAPAFGLEGLSVEASSSFTTIE